MRHYLQSGRGSDKNPLATRSTSTGLWSCNTSGCSAVFIALGSVSACVYHSRIGLPPTLCCILLIYALKNRKTTWFFVSWGLSSVCGIYVMFMVCVSPHCVAWHTAGISGGFVTMLACYVYVLISGRLLKQTFANDYSIERKDDLNCCFCTLGPFPRFKHCRLVFGFSYRQVDGRGWRWVERGPRGYLHDLYGSMLHQRNGLSAVLIWN